MTGTNHFLFNAQTMAEIVQYYFDRHFISNRPTVTEFSYDTDSSLFEVITVDPTPENK